MAPKLSHVKYSLGVVGVFFLVSISVAAQGGSISGNVFLPNGGFLNERAKISLQTERGVKSRVYTDDRGRFQFNQLTPAIYEIVVEPDGNRFDVARAKVEVFQGGPSILNINLKEKKPSGPSASSKAVSTGELDSAIPASAKKEFEQAIKLASSGDIANAIARLRKAIEIYPNYLMAHNDLGAQLLAQ